jgi:hypothetical protein
MPAHVRQPALMSKKEEQQNSMMLEPPWKPNARGKVILRAGFGGKAGWGSLPFITQTHNGSEAVASLVGDEALWAMGI